MKNFLLYIFLMPLLLLTSPNLSGSQVAHADGSWNSPLVYAFDNEMPIALPTRFKVDFDAENLRILVECSEPAMDKIRLIPKDEKRGWPMCDSIEIFIDPPQLKKYVQLAVGVNGMVYDSRKNKSQINWKKELRFYSDRWTVEFIIPFADLGVTAAVGDVWRLNLCRNVRTGSNFNSTWAHVGSAFHNPANFGTLIFGAPEAARRAMKLRMERELAALESELKAKGIYDELKAKVDSARSDCTVQKLTAIREEALMLEKLKEL